MVESNYIEVDPPPETRRFWLGVSLLVVGLLALIGLVILQGSHAALRARHLQPAPGSEVSVRPEIRLLFARPLDKGSVERAVTVEPPVPFELGWAENELRLLLRAPLQAGLPYTVTVGPGVLDASGIELEGSLSWSFRTRQPRVAFIRQASTGRGELWIASLEGEAPRRLSAEGQIVLDVDAAPNGKMLAYTVEEGSSTVALWRAEPLRGSLTRLLMENEVLYSAPRFSPGSELLALERRAIVNVGDQGAVLGPPSLVLRRPGDGSPAGEIYGQGPQIGHTPRWSPTGTHLAFYAADEEAVGIFNFTDEILFFPGESASLGNQAWSPDGRALTYTIVSVSEQGARQLLVVRDLQLGTEHLLGEAVGDQADPAWSPDGALIAYAYRPPPGMLEAAAGIWVMRPDGSGKLLLVSEPDVIYTQPLWSPDGQWLLFGRFDPNSTQGSQSLWVVRRDGSNPQRVTEVGFQHTWLP